jgi:NADH dehydrogenase FAD-containing subunit
MKTLVLAGGGHAHLHCLEQLKKEAPEDVQVLLISPSVHQYYSGMFSGFTEGVYNIDDIRIDLSRLSEKIGVAFVKDTIQTIDPIAKELTGASGKNYPYDIVSFDIGSQTAIPRPLKKHVSSIKPNYRFPYQLLRLREATHPIVVGGGASGVELAFSIQAWRKQQGLPLNTTLFSSGSLLASQGKSASHKIEAVARRKDLPIVTGVTVEVIDDEKVLANNGKSYPQTDVLWLTGPTSAELFSRSALAADDAGFLLVNERLQSTEHPAIFGAGDCISIDRYPALAKNGVYAVRQGPVLWNNLKNSLSDGTLMNFTPQKRFVSILSTGGGEAFLTYGERSLHGRIPWKLKQRIDRKFMKRYKDLYE